MTPTDSANPAMGAFYGRRIVVTGGAGFLGRVVVRKLRERGCHDVSVPRRATCDLTRVDNIEKVFVHARPHLLLHLAASAENPDEHVGVADAFYRNVMMSTQIIEAARRHGLEKMIYLGSASSYPVDAPIPLREDALFTGPPEAARFEHGIAKRLPIIQALACRKQFGFECVCLIPTNFYGPGDNFDQQTSFVIPSLISRFLEAVEIGARYLVIGGTGRATRDFIHVEDCAEAILLALEHYRGADPVNIATGVEVSMRRLAESIAVLTGFSGEIQWNPNHPEGAPRRVLDVTRAQNQFGFRARRSLSDGLFETVEWYRSTLAQLTIPSQRTEAAIPVIRA